MNVSDVLRLGDSLTGRAIRVNGRAQVSVQYSERPCPPNLSDCNPIAGIEIVLQDLQDARKRLLIYRAGKPYPCSVDKRGAYDCQEFVHNKVMTIEGIYTKSKESDFTMGSASPNGDSRVQVIRFRDKYYLDIRPR